MPLYPRAYKPCHAYWKSIRISYSQLLPYRSLRQNLLTSITVSAFKQAVSLSAVYDSCPIRCYELTQWMQRCFGQSHRASSERSDARATLERNCHFVSTLAVCWWFFFKKIIVQVHEKQPDTVLFGPGLVFQAGNLLRLCLRVWYLPLIDGRFCDYTSAQICLDAAQWLSCSEWYQPIA